MIRRDRTDQLCAMLGAPIQCCIDRKFVFANCQDSDLWRAFFARSIWTRAENCGFFESQLETTKDDGVKGVRFDSGKEGNSVPWPVAGSISFHNERNTFLGNVTRFWLAIHGPGRMQLVLVD